MWAIFGGSSLLLFFYLPLVGLPAALLHDESSRHRSCGSSPDWPDADSILQFLTPFILPPWRQKPRMSSGSAAGECVYLEGFEVQPNGRKRCYLAASEASAGRGHGRASLRLA